MRRRSPLAVARVALYATLLGCAAYLVWRYDLVRLPGEGCSPLVGFAPGDRLVVERRALRGPAVGDAVLYRGDADLFLGRVQEPPPSAPAAYWEAVAAGALWVVNERPDCPGPDSRLLGPIPAEDVWGRVAFALPW